MNTLDNWLAKIEASHPIDIDMGLTRVAQVAKSLAINFHNSTVITVAGTNGKGTTCRLIEQACMACGLTVGVYSSPHILTFNERIRLNALDVSDQSICDAFESIENARGQTSLTYFEYATLAGMLLFQRANVQVVILEVGLGGRLDATNIVDADISVITSIALDHQNYLGDTCDDIAREKVGIIKPNKRSVIGFEQRYDKAETFVTAQNSALLRRGDEFTLDTQDQGFVGEIVFAEIRHRYHWHVSAIPAQNVMTAVASLWWLTQCVPPAQAKSLIALLNDAKSMTSLIESTSLAGRAQLVRRSPDILLDVAHNPASAEYLVSKIGTFTYRRCHIVVGMLKDKNIEQTLHTLSKIRANWYCATLPTQRGQSFERLVQSVPAESARKIEGHSTIASALTSAIKHAARTDMIVVVGSFVSVAEAMQFLNKHSPD